MADRIQSEKVFIAFGERGVNVIAKSIKLIGQRGNGLLFLEIKGYLPCPVLVLCRPSLKQNMMCFTQCYSP